MESSGRRLAAVMFTDIVGYACLVQRHERLALELLEEHRSLIRPLITHCEGSEVKTIGDGFLIEFPSALQAVRCAVEIQRALRAHAATQPATRSLGVRIGVHLGDVEHHEGDILGDGVNIASRIQPLAESGGICVSSQVYDQVENKLEVQFVCLGPQTLKHIARPVEVYRVVHPWEEPPMKEQPETQPPNRKTVHPSKPSVAVLPFANVSTDPENECFCDGLTEDILAQLATIGSLKVISRTSVMRYKGRTDKPLRDIANELGVATILEGTARKDGDRVRIVAQLIDAHADEHLWAKTYDRYLTDIFAIQTEVAEAIACALQATITGAERERIEKQPTKNLEAYRLVLQARFDLNIRSWTQELIEQAHQILQRAIELDPDYAQAHCALADAYRFLAQRSSESRGTEEWLSKAEGAVRRALELDDTLAEAHYAAGALARDRRDWAQAEQCYRRALELNPNTALAHNSYAKMLSYHGRRDEALEHILRARELDPNNTDAWRALIWIYFRARQYERALDEIREFLRSFPDSARNFDGITGEALYWLRRYEESLAQFILYRERAPEFEQKDCLAETCIAIVEERLGQEGVLRQTLERWEAETDKRKVAPFTMAAGYILLDDHERALDSLELAYERNPWWLVTIKVEPAFDPLRGHRRFQKLLTKLGLADVHQPPAH